MSEQKPASKSKGGQNDFFQDVYDVVRLIPAGRATSYGAIAAYLGAKRGARMVGWAMGNSYTQQGIPAHRVVNRDGLLTAKLLFDTPTTMQERLEAEGVEVKNDTIQNWQKVFWNPETELN